MNIKFVNKRDLKKLSDKELYSLVGKSRDFADLVLDEYYFRESELIKKINIITNTQKYIIKIFLFIQVYRTMFKVEVGWQNCSSFASLWV